MHKYEILVRYIKLYFKEHSLMTREDAELILKALEEPKEEENE